jgi:uracil-DNA glycosylase
VTHGVIDSARLAAGWAPWVDAFARSDDGARLARFLAERRGGAIYPPEPMRALQLTPMDAVRAVIVGQDPYHGAGQAHGLAFSVPAGVALPPSLRNIYTELAREYGAAPRSGDLTPWARQGVLLLNAVLTVDDGQPGSHAGQGWEQLTDTLIAALGAAGRPRAFLLWGAHAQRAARHIDAAAGHLVLTANHPSPLSARRPPQPFIGCGHFACVNAFLRARGEAPIDWVGAAAP